MQAIPMGLAGKAIVSAGGSGVALSQWTAGQVGSVGISLAINSGTIDLADATAKSLLGNAGTGTAIPSNITIGAGLTLTETGTTAAGTLANSGVLNITTSGSGIAVSANTGSVVANVEWNAGTVSSIGTGLTLTSGTLTGSSGLVSAVTSNFTVASGTLDLAHISQYQVFGRSGSGTGTAAPIDLLSLFSSEVGGIAQGSMVYGSGISTMTHLVHGNNGQILVQTDPGGNPTPAWAGSIIAVGTNAIALGVTGPTGAGATPQAYLEIVLAGTTYYLPMF